MSKIIYTIIAAFLIVYFSSAQSINQKKEIFDGVGVFLNAKYLNKQKPNNINFDKDTFFKKAVIIPVKKFDLSSKKNVCDENLYYIIYESNLYFYNSSVNLLPDNIFTKKLIDLNNKFKNVFVGCLLFSRVVNDEIFISNDTNEFIVDYFGVEVNNYENFIRAKFGSIAKYNELDYFYNNKSKVTVEKINEAIRNNYHLYESTCAKDSLLILNVFISQVNLSIGGLDKIREKLLRDRIINKIDPFLKLLKEGKISKDSYIEYKKSIKQDNIKTDNFNNSYNLTIYGIDIMDDLLFVLTKQEFVKYLDYIDTFQPLIHDKIKDKRIIYGIDILEKSGLIDSKDPKSFYNYIHKIIQENGCSSSN